MPINFSLSLWWRPILGSSSTYKTPTKAEPIWVANLILWASPPDRVPAFLDNVKYSKPTFFKNDALSFISFNISWAINWFFSLKCKFSIKFSKSFIDKLVTSIMFLPPIKTDKTSFFNLLPLHLGQGISAIYSSIFSLE